MPSATQPARDKRGANFSRTSIEALIDLRFNSRGSECERLGAEANDEAYSLCGALRGGTTSLNDSKPFHAGSTGVTPACGT